MSLSVSVNPRGTGFVQLGKNHRYKVVPESIKYGSDINEYGALDCSMMLQINPLFPHYDLEQYTPIVINDGTVDLWSGRIIGTPIEYGNSGIITVEGQGWGQHTKDDCSPNSWVRNDCLTDAQDSRQYPTCDLAHYLANPMVTIGDGAATINIPTGSSCVGNQFQGFYIDFGPDPSQWAKRLTWTWACSANTGTSGISWYCSNGNGGDGTIRSEDLPGNAGVLMNANPGPNVGNGTFAVPRRFVVFFVYVPATTTVGADLWVRITNLCSYTKAAYESSQASILKASTAISESLDLLCPLYSSDRSRISATSLVLPNFPGTKDDQYTNQLIDKANAPHGYKFYLTPQPVPTPVFEPQDSDYTFVLGIQDEYSFKDPSRNDGRAVYNNVKSAFVDATGADQIASYTTPWTQIYQNIPNPSFDVNTAGWQMSSGTIARDTSTFDSTPASGLMTGDSGGHAVCDQLITPLQLQPLTKYRCIIKMRKNSSADCRGNLYVRDENGSPLNMTIKSNYDDVFSAMDFVTWYSVSVDFITSASGKVLGPGFSLTGTANNPVLWVDTVAFYGRSASVIDKRGFTRTALRPMEAKSTSAIASNIALLEYNNSQFPPLKGSVEVTGTIRLKNGQRIKVNRVPSMVGKAILFEQFRDPNTGAFGRQATIKAASYDEITNTVSITCDNDFNFIQNLRARLLL